MLGKITFTKVLIVHIVALFSVFFSLYFLELIKFFPSNLNIVQWDAGWYSSIASDGYIYREGMQSNTGFFPLFPLLWKAFSFSSLGISIFNYGVFILGVFLLKITVPNLSYKILLLSLSFPSLLFMYVPYSEALFFMLASLYIYGNHIDNRIIKVVSLLLLSFTRPTIFFFLPALIFSEILSSSTIKEKVINIFLNASSIAIGTVASFYFIGSGSDNFFAYSDSQINNWNHTFSIPKFPLTTWRGYRILWLDAFGLWIVISSLIASFVYFIKTLTSKWGIVYNKNLLLSLSYLSMTFIYVLFFHAKEKESGLTSILSLNRYVFCSPFFMYLYYYYFNDIQLKINKVLFSSMFITVVLVGFPFYNVIQLTYLKSLGFFFGVLVFFFAQMIPRIKNKQALFLITYVMNIFLQIYLFQSFLKGNWIG